jgi:hypothetical protein
MHEFLTRGIRSVTFTDQYGAVQNPTIRPIDQRDPERNDFMAAHQVTVVDGEHRRRFDVMLYVNGGAAECFRPGAAGPGRCLPARCPARSCSWPWQPTRTGGKFPGWLRTRAV